MDTISGKLFFRVNTTNTTDVYSSTVPALDRWYHVAGTYNGSAMIIYVNGVQENTTSRSGAITVNTNKLFIGKGNANSQYFNGSVDELAIWNRTLSSSEILSLYKRGALHLNLSVRSCDDAACSSESFADINDTSPQTLSLTNNRYFQYNASFETDNTTYTPELYNVTVYYTVDRTPPNVTLNFLNNPVDNSNFSLRTNNRTFNASVFDALTLVDTVYFWFDNGTGKDFNITGTNISGQWSASYNVSALAEERQGVRVVANDTVNNVNSTFVINFTVDRTSPNITLNFLNNPVDNSNFSLRTNNRTFNASVFDALLQVDTVYFWFDNGTGKDFNITGTNISGQWSVSYNVSALAEEKQGVRIVANDTIDNVNSSFVINFTVDRTPPAVNITAPSASATVSGTQTFNATVTDLLTEVNIVLFQFSNGTNPFNRTASNTSGMWNVSVDTTTITEGTLTVTIFANDTVGNMNNTQTLSLTVDNVVEAAPGGAQRGGGGGGVTATVIKKEEAKAEIPEEAPEIIEEKVPEKEKPSEEAVPELPGKKEEPILDKKSIFAILRGYLSLDKLSNLAGKATAQIQNSLQKHPAAYLGVVIFIIVAALTGGGVVYVQHRLRKKSREKAKKIAGKNRVEIFLLKDTLLRDRKQRKLYKIRKKDTSAIEQSIQRKEKMLKQLQGKHLERGYGPKKKKKR